MQSSELWYGEGAGPSLARLALTPLSWLYAGGWQAYLAMYRQGIKKAAEPHRPVLCVGNLVVGGSGKSPMVHHLAGVLRGLGHEVVLSCSGYGSPRAEAATLAPDGPLNPSEWGDEPAMLRWLLPDVPIVVGRRRVLAAQLVHERFPNAVMLMDDGFQHLPLKKHLTIVLDDPNPRNRHCLPAGPYREPQSNRRRADLVLPDRLRIVADPIRLETPEGIVREASEYDVLCALGQPAKFLEALARDHPRWSGSDLLLPDHDPLDAGNLLGRLSPERPAVVTAKDWVKLRERPDVATREFLIARHAVRVEPEAEFRTWLQEHLHAVPHRGSQ